MPNFNKVILLGRLVADPEVKDAGNSKVVKFTIAETRTYTKNEEKQEETSFIDCDAFGNTATTIGKFFTKGNHILVEGRLRQDKWEDKESGQKRSKLVVVVENFNFIDPPQNKGEPAEEKKPVAKPQGNKGKIPF